MNLFAIGNLIVCGITVSLLGACGDDDKSVGKDSDAAVEADVAGETDAVDTGEVADDVAVEIEDDTVVPDVAEVADADVSDVTDVADVTDVSDVDSAEVTPSIGTLHFIDISTPVEMSSDGDIALIQDLTVDPVQVYFYSVLADRADKKTTVGSPLENFATGFSDGGRVTALYSSPVVAGVWSEEAGWQVVASPYETGCDNNRAGAWDVSADGKVVVGFFWDGCTTSSFRWTDASGTGVTTPLERLGASSLETRGPVNRATVLSDDGQVAAGFAENLTADRSPAIWHADGTGFLLAPDEVEVPGEILTLSPDGKIAAGTWGNAGFYWTEAEGVVYTGVPPEGLGSDATFVNAIAADGKLLFGASGDQFFGIPQAFVWTKAAGARYLANVLAEAGVVVPEGYILTNAVSASQDGTVVLGSAYDGAGNPKSFVLQLPVSAYGIE